MISFIHTLFTLVSIAALGRVALIWNEGVATTEMILLGVVVLVVRFNLWLDMRNELVNFSRRGISVPVKAIFAPLTTWLLWIPACFFVSWNTELAYLIISVLFAFHSVNIVQQLFAGSIGSRVWPWLSLWEPTNTVVFSLLALRTISWNPLGNILIEWTTQILVFLLVFALLNFVLTRILEQRHG